MKKKIKLIMLFAMMAAMLCACGKKGDDSLSDNQIEVDPDDYVKLGDYSGLSVEVTYYDYSEEDVKNCVDSELEFYVDYYANSYNLDLYDYQVDLSANTVAQGSIVNMDYTGRIDGVAFEGGSAEGAHLVIGSGKFIPGFEDGLVDKQVGETVDLDLTFPEDYQNADYAGKNAVFTVSINSIDTRSMPEYTDELIQTLNISQDITTYQQYEDYIRQYLQDSCDDANEQMLQESIWNAAYGTCEVSDPPQQMVDSFYEDLNEYFETYAQYYSMDLETFISSQMSMDMETYQEKNREAATEEAKKELAYMAIAKAEGIVVDDAMMQEAAEAEYADYGYESADAMIQTMGKADFSSYVMRQKVLKRLEEIVTVKENEPVSIMETAVQQ